MLKLTEAYKLNAALLAIKVNDESAVIIDGANRADEIRHRIADRNGKGGGASPLHIVTARHSTVYGKRVTGRIYATLDRKEFYICVFSEEPCVPERMETEKRVAAPEPEKKGGGFALVILLVCAAAVIWFVKRYVNP